MEYGWVEKNHAKRIPLPRRPEPIPKYLSKEQLNELREIAKENPVHSAIIETLYATGARVSELTKIEHNHIHWEKKLIQIFGKGNKERLVPFSSICEATLLHYLSIGSTSNKYLFMDYPKKSNMRIFTVQIILDKYSNDLGFKVTPHTLRHTFAAHLAKQGMPDQYIQALLGHVNEEDTQVYSRLFASARKNIYDRYY